MSHVNDLANAGQQLDSPNDTHSSSSYDEIVFKIDLWTLAIENIIGVSTRFHVHQSEQRPQH